MSVVGWYVHHHGAGHLTRFLAVRPHLDHEVVVFSSMPAPARLPDRTSWVILPRDAENEWLDPRLSAEDALDLLQIYPDDELEAFPVNPKVGNVTFDDPSCVVPLPPEDVLPEGQLSLL